MDFQPYYSNYRPQLKYVTGYLNNMQAPAYIRRPGDFSLDDILKQDSHALLDKAVNSALSVSYRIKIYKDTRFSLEEKWNEISAQIGALYSFTLRDIFQKAQTGDPYLLKGLLFRIIEVVEWTEDPSDKSQGHCRISYFETPHLKFPIKNSEQLNKELFAECMNWGE